MADRIEVMYSEEEVNKKILELGRQITEEFRGKEITMITFIH